MFLLYRKIFEAASSNNIGFVQEALNGAYGENRQEDLELGLIRASGNGHKECVKLFLENKVSVLATNGNEDTALILAAQNGHVSIVKLLLEHGSPVNHQNSMGYTALMKSCENGHIEIVDLLLKHGAIDTSGEIGEEHAGVANGVAKLPQFMPHGYTSLMVTVLKQPENSQRILKLLLDAKFNPNSRDLQDMTVLHHAANKCVDDTVELLLQHGAAVNAKDVWGVTPLMSAVAYGKVNNVRTLLRYGADIKVTCKAKRTALSIAARTGSEEMLITVLEAGADLNTIDAHGNVPLFVAIQHYNYEAVKCLIQAGCDLKVVCRDLTSYQRMTCFQCALNRRNVQLIEMLYQSGAFSYRELFDAVAAESLKQQTPENQEVVLLLNKLAKAPVSLRSVCRTVIREKCAGHQSWVDSVAQLKLPKSLRKYLVYSDLHIPVTD